MEWAAFLILALHEVGKSLSHSLRHEEWARQPLIAGLPISDVYHACSGVQWLAVLYAGLCAWGLSWEWWAACAAVWGTIWPLSKIPKGLTLKEAINETWYMQLIRRAT